jgi:hypothetical protein
VVLLQRPKIFPKVGVVEWLSAILHFNQKNMLYLSERFFMLLMYSQMYISKRHLKYLYSETLELSKY